MGSFTNINTYAQQTVTFTDNRTPGLRIFPPVPVNQTFDFDQDLSEPVPLRMGTTVEAVIRPADASAFMEIKTPDAPGATVQWTGLPAGVTLVPVTSSYWILSPINSVADWNSIATGGTVTFAAGADGDQIVELALNWFAGDELITKSWAFGTTIPFAIIRPTFTLYSDPSVIFAPRYDWFSEFEQFTTGGFQKRSTVFLTAQSSVSAVKKRFRGISFARTAVFTLNSQAKRFRSTNLLTTAEFNQSITYIRYRDISPVTYSSNTSIDARNVRVRIQSVEPIESSTVQICNADKTIFVPEMVASTTMNVSAVKTVSPQLGVTAEFTQPNTKFTRTRAGAGAFEAEFAIPLANLIKNQMVLFVDVTSLTYKQIKFHLSGPAPFTINWGDGTIQTVSLGDGTFIDNTSTQLIHEYDSPGQYFVEINTSQPFRFYYPGGRALREIKTYHKIGFTGIDYLFGAKDWDSWLLQDNNLDPLDGQTLPTNYFTSSKGLYSRNRLVMPLPGESAAWFGINNLREVLSQSTDMSFMFYNIATELAGGRSLPVNNLDTSNVVTMESMFAGDTLNFGSLNFTADLSNWDTSNVTNMKNMFKNCSSFGLYDAGLSNWDVSNVTDMSGMFEGCAMNDLPLNTWNTAALTNAHRMFYNALGMNQPLSNWNTANVTDMSYMFYNAYQFDQPIGNWNTANVTNMAYMFADESPISTRYSRFNQDISAWDTSKVTNMTAMFKDARLFNQDLSGWCVTLIPTKPSQFDTDAFAWTLPRPVWGTCPA